MEISADLAVLDALDSSRDAPYNPQRVTAESKPPALDIGELKADLPDKVVIDERPGSVGEDVGSQDSKGVSLAGEDILLALLAVVVGGCDYATAIVVVSHRWFVIEVLLI